MKSSSSHDPKVLPTLHRVIMMIFERYSSLMVDILGSRIFSSGLRECPILTGIRGRAERIRGHDFFHPVLRRGKDFFRSVSQRAMTFFDWFCDRVMTFLTKIDLVIVDFWTGFHTGS